MTLQRAKEILDKFGSVKVVCFDDSTYEPVDEFITDRWVDIQEAYDKYFDCVFSEV